MPQPFLPLWLPLCLSLYLQPRRHLQPRTSLPFLIELRNTSPTSRSWTNSSSSAIYSRKTSSIGICSYTKSATSLATITIWWTGSRNSFITRISRKLSKISPRHPPERLHWAIAEEWAQAIVFYHGGWVKCPFLRFATPPILPTIVPIVDQRHNNWRWPQVW